MFKTCNAFTDGFDYKKNIIIISEHYEEIGNGIIEVIGRGVTYLYAEGAYTHQQRKVLLVVAKLTQVAKIKQIVRDIDPGCFMIIQDANDVFGKGFTSKPSAHKKNKKIFCTVDTLKQKIIINCFNLLIVSFIPFFYYNRKLIEALVYPLIIMLLLAGILNLYTFFVYTGTFIVPLGRFIAFFSIRLLKTFVFIIVIFL